MIESLYAGVLLLDLTGISSFIAPFLGFESRPLSLSLTLASLLYLAWHWPLTRRLLLTKTMLEWETLQLFWPAAVIVILKLGGEGQDVLRMIGVHLRLAALMAGAAVFIAANGWERFRRMAWVALGVTVAGFAMNWLWPQQFARVSLFQQELIEFSGRTAGFFGHANVAASTIIALTFVLLATQRRIRLLHRAGLVAGMMLLVAVTGSRGCTAVACLAALLIAWESRHELRLSRRRASLAVAVVALAVVFFAATLLFFLGLGWTGDWLSQGQYANLGSRLQFWAALGTGDAFEDDQSVEMRLGAQSAYVALIGERPILGYGAAANRELVQTGTLDRSSHNTFLSAAVFYGVPYALFVLWVLLRGLRELGESPLIVRRLVRAEILVTLGFCMLASWIFVHRALMLVLGAVLALKLLPNRALTDLPQTATERPPDRAPVWAAPGR